MEEDVCLGPGRTVGPWPGKRLVAGRQVISSGGPGSPAGQETTIQGIGGILTGPSQGLYRTRSLMPYSILPLSRSGLSNTRSHVNDTVPCTRLEKR